MCSNLEHFRPIFANVHSCLLMHFSRYGLWHVLSEGCIASIPIIRFKCPLASRFSRYESHCVDGVHSYRVNLIFLVEEVTSHQNLPYSIPFERGATHYWMELWMCIAINRITLSVATLFTIDEWDTRESKCNIDSLQQKYAMCHTRESFQIQIQIKITISPTQVSPKFSFMIRRNTKGWFCLFALVQWTGTDDEKVAPLGLWTCNRHPIYSITLCATLGN